MEKINCVRYLVIILITAIFIIAFINHIVVNMRCETIMEEVSENLLDIKNCIVEIRNDTCLLSGIKRQDMDSIQVNKLLRDFDTQREVYWHPLTRCINNLRICLMQTLLLF